MWDGGSMAWRFGWAENGDFRWALNGCFRWALIFYLFPNKKWLDKLSAQDIERLVEIRDRTHKNSGKCIIEILLGNKQSAEIYFNKMDEADKEIFKRNPIYNLGSVTTNG